MKSQTLAVSVVLLLMAVATLPGLSFSLSSSVTSYNNSITINGGIVIDKKNFNANKIDNDLFEGITNIDEAYEIVSDSGSFCNDKSKWQTANLTIPNDKRFIINIKIDNFQIWNASGFKIAINYKYTDESGESQIMDVSAGPLYGHDVAKNGSAQGYLFEDNGWHLNEKNASQFGPANGNITVTIDGREITSPIHFYIIFIENQGAGT